jgi:hypothetical protein
VCVCVVSLAALPFRFPVCSVGLVVSLYDTHQTEPLGRNCYISLTVLLTTRDVADAHEADTLGRNSYDHVLITFVFFP